MMLALNALVFRLSPRINQRAAIPTMGHRSGLAAEALKRSQPGHFAVGSAGEGGIGGFGPHSAFASAPLAQAGIGNDPAEARLVACVKNTERVAATAAATGATAAPGCAIAAVAGID